MILELRQAQVLHYYSTYLKLCFACFYTFSTVSTAWLAGATPQAERPVEPVLGGYDIFFQNSILIRIDP
jgi:hypothetical protein